MQKLADDKINHVVQKAEELVHIPLCQKGKPWQIHGSKGQIAATTGHLARGIVDIAHDAGAAAHVGHLGIVVPRTVVLKVEGSVEVGEIREKALCGHTHGQLEEIVIGILGIVADTLLHLEDLHRENGCLTAAKAAFRCQKELARHHTAFRTCVCAVVDGGEGYLCTSPGVHGVQIVDERLHGLVGVALRAAQGCLFRVGGQGLALLGIHGGGPFLGKELQGHADALCEIRQGQHVHRLYVGNYLGSEVCSALVIRIFLDLDPGCHGVRVGLAEGLGNAWSHGKVEVGYGLAAVHLVLVGLDDDTGKGRTGNDVLRGAQMAVAGGKAVGKKLQGIDLAAGLSKQIEVLVVDVDVARDVGSGNVRGQHMVVAEILGSLGAVFEHGAHGAVAVHVGVLALHVHCVGRGEGKRVVDAHERTLHIAAAGVIRTVEDIGLGCGRKAELNQGVFHQILHVFHCHCVLFRIKLFDHLVGHKFDVLIRHDALALRHIVGSAVNGSTDLAAVKGNHLPITFSNGLWDHDNSLNYAIIH